MSLKHLAALTSASVALQCDASRQLVIESLLLEGEHLASQLSAILQSVREHIPLHPLETHRLQDELQSWQSVMPASLSGRLMPLVQSLSDLLRSVSQSGEHYSAPLYAEYADRLVSQYVSSSRWQSSQYQLLQSEMCLPSGRQSSYRASLQAECRSALVGMSPYVLEDDRLQMEVLGRCLWHWQALGRHADRSRLLHEAATWQYLSRHTEEAAESSDDAEALLRMQWLADTLPAIVFRLQRISHLMQGGMTADTVARLLTELLSRHADLLLSRSRGKALPKFVLQTLGSLMAGGWLDGSHPHDIVSRLGYRRPSAESQISYLRRGWKDTPVLHQAFTEGA